VLLVVLTVVSVNLGIFISTFSRNEFQVVQFIPLALAPQVFLSGVILPVEQMPIYMEGIARALPLTYAVEGMKDIMLKGQGLEGVVKELSVLLGFAVALLTLAATTIKRSQR
jgi:ABC-2 type transport system permease protein